MARRPGISRVKAATTSSSAPIWSALRSNRGRLWFAALDPLPGPAELAARYGDATGLGVHPGPESVRYQWLDRAQRQARPR